MPEFEIDDDLVRRLSSLLEETGLTEIEYEAGGHRIRVARNNQVSVGPMAAAAASIAAGLTDRTAGHPGANSSIGPEAAPAGAVTAPMVGTAYLAPEPAAPAFAAVGDTVTEGQTLLIIEAMKVMNQIPSPRAGKVVQILVESGQPVEFGEPLMVIE